MGLDDITKKAKAFLNDNRVKDALTSEQAEEMSDKVLGATADAANKVTGGKYEEQIEGARTSADDKIGTDDKPPAT
ncbi:antitoxin [Cryobacterium sp. TMT1-21]|uniref:Antitoxin n=1 Tax=Cryobacterium shii TaxID=1259235 RepID=A0AAQ2C4N2_9MICO|nr:MULTISPECIES: Rv0909 family putative TA system antitoxin [Cryobacterium]TFC43411.1 antitoxin [Cryobacterium shii]TFC89579.1 antitoxin [Cryobacterium sp. TmT2-59]TFD10453.1 antitoxin [Cryobacterium sp. TMT1-21]TFD14207.1 antitoxin [Cryobacterium sp. TMT4-10]TFD20211.1 antitoxin [Cryobacterium sp. TMT2-23]